MKKALIIVWGIILAVFTVLLINRIQNDRMIEHYENEIYRQKDVSVLGMIEPYKYYYNRGNILYKQGRYEEAEENYRKALKHHIPEMKECSVRINLALSMVTPLDLENIGSDNLDDIINTLESARDILVEEGCAHMDDDDGHSEDAQTLKNEIDELLDQLKNSEPPTNPPEEETPSDPENETQSNPENETPSEPENESQSNPENETTEPETEEETTGNSENETQTSEGETQTSEGETQTSEGETETSEEETEDELEKKLREIEQQGMNERNQNLGNYKYFDDFEYYDGDCW